MIPPDVGLNIERKAGTSVQFTLTGAVKLGPTGIFIQGGSNSLNPSNFQYVANPYPTASVTLANSNLYTGNPATGFLGGITPSSSDQLSLYDTVNGATIYYYNTSKNRWQNGGNDASNVVIPAGSRGPHIAKTAERFVRLVRSTTILN